MTRIALFICLVFGSIVLRGQEVFFEVRVQTPSLQTVDPKVFETGEVKAMGDVFSLRKIYEEHLQKFKGIENPGDWFHIGTPEALEGLDGLV